MVSRMTIFFFIIIIIVKRVNLTFIVLGLPSKETERDRERKPQLKFNQQHQIIKYSLTIMIMLYQVYT